MPGRHFAMHDVRLLSRLADVPARHWDALHDNRNPFVTHAFLSGLEQHGCLRAEWGWTPRHLTLWEGDALVAAAPMYLKDNSHGEFVFDHAWAHAYARHGLDYFPKWLCAVPYSPVTGPRLLARDGTMRHALVEAMVTQCQALGLPSVHVNFHTAAEDDEDRPHEFLAQPHGLGGAGLAAAGVGGAHDPQDGNPE